MAYPKNYSCSPEHVLPSRGRGGGDMGHLGAVEVILKQKDGHIGPADALHRPLEAQPGTW
jgi:hypothetical protein